nr:MAG TPA: hypothetical protein [Caudoviricetes sp.]
MKLFLDEKLVTGNLTQDGVLAYIALKKIMDENIFLKKLEIVEDCISVTRMAFTLVGVSDKYPKALTDALQRGIYELEMQDKIEIVQSFGKGTEYVLNMKNLYLNTTEGQYFVMVSSDEVRQILTSEGDMKKKISVLKYYIVLISTFDWSANMKCKDNMPNLQGKIGHMTQEYVAGLASISGRTCQRYNVVLEDEMKMIYIYRSNDKIREGDSLKQITNCYSRYEDKELCELYASDFENKMGQNHRIMRTKKNKKQADNNRRLAQIYNRICEGYGDTYDEDTVRKVFKYVTNKNKIIMDEIDRKQSQSKISYSDEEWIEKLQSQVRDTLIFEQFDYLNEELSEEKEVWGAPEPDGDEEEIERIFG